MSEALLRDIAEYCRSAGIAESTFGRLAVNDGKLVGRLRLGGRVTTDTIERVRAFIAREPRPAVNGVPAALPVSLAPPTAAAAHNFRFYDNRQKYLLFVTTCSEKQVIAQRVGMELANIHPRPPALRVFDAGMGDGTVLARTMRAMHTRFPTMPSYIVGKELSVEDVRLVLEKMPDRLFEHPAMVLVITNMLYSEAQAQLGDLGHQPRLARGLVDRQHGARIRGADQRPPALSRRALGCPHQPQHRQSGL
jgi:hypothetical protein